MYSIATSTLFFSVLYDLEISHGSPLISNTRSARLKEILNKSNDFHKPKIEAIDDQPLSVKTETKF